MGGDGGMMDAVLLRAGDSIKLSIWEKGLSWSKNVPRLALNLIHEVDKLKGLMLF